MPQDTLPLLRLRPDDIARRALVVGDPARAQRAAEMLDTPEKIGDNREYVTYGGSFEGRRVCITSHGVGAAIFKDRQRQLLEYGLAERGVGLVTLTSDDPEASQCRILEHPEVLDRLREIERQIVAGEIEVEDPMFPGRS